MKNYILLKDDGSNFDDFFDSMCDDLQTLWKALEKNSEQGFEYAQLSNWQKVFKPYGLTFDYYLDAQPFKIKLKTS